MSIHTLKVEEENKNKRLDVFIAQTLSELPSRSFIKKVIDSGNVTINGVRVKAHHKVLEGDEIIVDLTDHCADIQNIKPENIPLDVFYENEDFIIINKPIGMIVHPASGCYSGTLVNALLFHYQGLSDCNTSLRPGIIHRLDQDTSGLIIVAKNNIAHTKIAKQFQKHLVKKQYVALVKGYVEFDEGLIDASLGRHPYHREKKSVQYDDSSKEAVTYYKVVKRLNDVTLINLFPKTGRTHQLRVHMAYLGHPILGDKKYGNEKDFFRLALHAKSIGFKSPTTNSYVSFSSPLPKEFFEKIKV